MVTFENPNAPQQPQKGVYAWYARRGDKRRAIYVGQAGQKNSVLPKGTLFRGVSELQRNTFTSNSPFYDKLDTDSIVGTALLFFGQNGYECMWKHISNDPQQEVHLVAQERPILQNEKTAEIRPEFRLKKRDGRWKLSDLQVRIAQDGIFQQLARYL
jgi:hypothetical protein